MASTSVGTREVASHASRGPAAGGARSLGRSRWSAWVAVGVLVAAPVALGAGDHPEPFDGAALTPSGLQAGDGQVTIGPVSPLDTPPVIARAGTLDLTAPSPDPVVVGFHEASFDDAVPFEPVGLLGVNDNTTKFSGGIEDLGGLEYAVLASRGRGHGATTAIDVVLSPDDPVLSPATGRVTEVSPYELYGQYADTRIEIQPADAPHLRVVLIHVRDVRVQVGDAVRAGETVLAGQANQFGFESQVDRYAGLAGLGHVHIEVKPPGGSVAD